MLRFIHRVCKGHILLMIMITFMGSLTSLVSLFASRFIINQVSQTSLEETVKAIRIFLLIIAISLFQLLMQWLNSYISNRVIPKNTLRIYEKMQSELFRKAAEVELACYEDSEFYNRFSLAVQQADSRAIAVLNTLTALLAALFGTVTMVGLIAGLEPMLLLIAFAQVGCTFFLNMRTVRVQRTNMLERVPVMRRAEYTKRVFYQQNFAKEIRIFAGLPDLMKEKFTDASEELQKLLRKYGGKLANLSGLQGTGNVLSNVLTLCYLAWKVLMEKKHLIGIWQTGVGRSAWYFRIIRFMRLRLLKMY